MTPLRNEDARLLRGLGRFVDDVDRPGQLHARVVRSTQAHAGLTRVDGERARAHRGVHAVLTAADLRPMPRIPVRLGPFDQPLDDHLQPLLADGEVRYVGEPVAVVVSEDPYGAEDAAELVAIEYDAREAVLDARNAPVHAATLRRGYGDADEAFAGAAHVCELELYVSRHTAVPMECRGLLADPGPDGVTIWGATKVPHFNRRFIAAVLGLPEDRVVLRAMDAGGGFGVRGELYPEDLLVPLLARRLGAPVKWIEDRAEHLVATNHSREQRHRLAGAFDADGRLRGLRSEIFHDNGAYVRTHGVVVPELTASMLPGPYRVPAYAATVHVALTSKTPCGTYRAPGRYESTFARERLLDLAAGELGIDPLDVRRRNLLRHEDLPHRRPVPVLGHDVEIAEGDFAGLLEHALASAGVEEWREEARAARADGRLAGVGCAVFMEKSGGGGFERARVDVSPSGRVRVASGATSLGQGVETVLARTVAAELGVDALDVEVVAGDTGLIEAGVGSWASRSTIFAGGSARRAAEATAQRAREVAGELLEAAAEDLELREGRVVVRGSPTVGVALGEVAAACDPASAARRGHEPGLGAASTLADAPMTYPYGVHLAQVEIDRETGGVRVLRYHVAYEVGHAVDRRMVDGQLTGGAAQGVGGALLEAFTYDANGQPQATSFMDYLLPTAAETPRVTTHVREDAPSRNPLGAKGAGEGGTTAAGAALAAAVDDALGRPGAVRELPLSPERVRALATRPEVGSAV